MAKKNKDKGRLPLIDFKFYTVLRHYRKWNHLYKDNQEMKNRDTVWVNYLCDYFEKNYKINNQTVIKE